MLKLVLLVLIDVQLCIIAFFTYYGHTGLMCTSMLNYYIINNQSIMQKKTLVARAYFVLLTDPGALVGLKKNGGRDRDCN